MGILDYIGGGVGAGSSGLGNMINSFLHPEKAYDKAAEESKRYWNEAKGYQMPYMQQGQQQYGNLMGAENALLNPVELQNKWAQSYEQSPYAKMLQEENTGQGLDAASSMGLMGSSGALNNIQRGAGMISAQDRRNYLQDLMEKYMKGVGIGENIYGIGATSAGELSRGAQGMGDTQAQLAYGKQNAPGKLFENMLRTGVGAYANSVGGAGGAGGGGGNLYNAGNQYNQ